MKRDMNLIRDLLLAIEATPAGQVYTLETDPVSGHDMRTLQEHLRLLEEAGYVRKPTLTRGGGCCLGLTWHGHEFLAASQTPDVWAEAMNRVKSIGGAVSVEVLKSLLTKIAGEHLGLN